MLVTWKTVERLLMITWEYFFELAKNMAAEKARKKQQQPVHKIEHM